MGSSVKTTDRYVWMCKEIDMRVRTLLNHFQALTIRPTSPYTVAAAAGQHLTTPTKFDSVVYAQLAQVSVHTHACRAHDGTDRRLQRECRAFQSQYITVSSLSLDQYRAASCCLC